MDEMNAVTTSANPTNGLAAQELNKRTGLSFKVYQDLKSSVHRDLLSKVDVEKIATVRDERTRAQVLAVIQDLVAGLKTPMSGRERERLAIEVVDEVFGLGPLEPLLTGSHHQRHPGERTQAGVCRTSWHVGRNQHRVQG